MNPDCNHCGWFMIIDVPMINVTIADGQVIPNHRREAIVLNWFSKIDFSGSDFP
jgi:hypothetical protein